MARRVTALVVALAILSACATLRPEQKPIYYANEVLLRVFELQTMTIDLYDSGKIDKQTAQIIVEFTVATAKTVKELPNGWQAIVKGAWSSVNEKLAKKIPDRLTPLWFVLDSLIRGLQ